MKVPDLSPKLCLLVVEVCPGERLLVHLALALGPGRDGLPAGDGRLHVSDHPLLLLQQLPVLDLCAQGRTRWEASPPPTPPHGTSREPTKGTQPEDKDSAALSMCQNEFQVHREEQANRAGNPEKRAEAGEAGSPEDHTSPRSGSWSRKGTSAPKWWNLARACSLLNRIGPRLISQWDKHTVVRWDGR